jgi:molybdopterin biosynthesis enzyme
MLDIEKNIKEIRAGIDQAEFAAAWMDGFSAKLEDVIREAQDRKYQ